MKKFVYVALVLIATPCVAFDTERVEEAIEQSLLSQVKSQCNKLDRDEALTAQARKKIYRNLHGLATDTNSMRTEAISIVGNWRDVAKTTSGALFTGAGLLVIAGGLLLKRDNESGRKVILAIAAGVASTGIGAFLLYKGITCSTQKAGIESAKSIEKYLKGKLTAEEPAKE